MLIAGAAPLPAAPAAARPGSLALAAAAARFCRLAPLTMMSYFVVTEGCRYDTEPRELPPPHHTNIPQRGLSPRREALSLAVLKVWRGGGVAREAVSKYGGSRWRQGVEGAVCCSRQQVERAGGRPERRSRVHSGQYEWIIRTDSCTTVQLYSCTVVLFNRNSSSQS
jgi:hypothetical protein